MKTKFAISLPTVLLFPIIALHATVASTDETDTGHGSVGAVAKTMAVEGGFTAVWQHADDARVDDEGVASFDLVIRQPAGPGTFTLFAEANTTPRTDGVASLLGEANADAGTALDADGDGRVQISELHYDLTTAYGEWTVGLLDLMGFFDTSAVANDETAQFLGVTLVNNPTFAHPDYTLGAVYHYHAADSGPGITVAVTSSHGLADNPKATYAELFDVDADGKGVFAAVEGYASFGPTLVRAGVWGNSADHPNLRGTRTNAGNHGVYGVIDGAHDAFSWNLRLGLANDDVSEGARFAGVALEIPLRLATMGAGLTRTWLADDAAVPGRDDFTQAELYARFEPASGWSITPSAQWLSNSGFDGSGTSIDDNVTVYGVRVGYTF